MKKNVKRMISLVLCVIMLAGMCTVSASAESNKPYRYVSLGDSTSMGYILNDFEWSHNHPDGASAYANYARVMDYLKNTWHIKNLEGLDLTLTGSRPTELRAILDKDFYGRFCDGNPSTDLNYCDQHLDGYMNDGTGKESYEQLNKKFTDAIANADLITYDLIMADQTSMAAGLAGNAKYYYGYASYSELLAAEGCEFLAESVAALRAGLEAVLGDTAASLNGFIDSMLCAYVADVVNFTKSLDIIYKLNPDVNLIVVGPYNAFEGKSLYMDGIEINIEKVYGVLLEALTSYMVSDKHSWHYRFADCSGGVQTLNTALGNGELDTYSYLVDQVLERSLGKNYKKAYSAEQIEAMKGNIQYACSLRRISLDVALNGAGNANLALVGSEEATTQDYEALCMTVLTGLDHAAGTHPDIVGYQQKFEAIKRAFVSPVAANGAYLTRIIDNTVSIVNKVAASAVKTSVGIAGLAAKLIKIR